jgi:hypothetical protein
MKNLFFSLSIFPLLIFFSMLRIQQNNINHLPLSIDLDENNVFKMSTSQLEEESFSQIYQDENTSITEKSYSSSNSSIIQEKKPKKTPRPTPIPLIIPPPANQTSSNIIVLLGVLSVLIVIFGVLINRSKIE